LKALKRDEIVDKLKKAEFLAGSFDGSKSKKTDAVNTTKLLEKFEKELQTQFIPDLYDKTMDQLFNEKYYNASDDEGKDLEKQKDIDLQIMDDNFDHLG